MRQFDDRNVSGGHCSGAARSQAARRNPLRRASACNEQPSVLSGESGPSRRHFIDVRDTSFNRLPSGQGWEGHVLQAVPSAGVRGSEATIDSLLIRFQDKVMGSLKAVGTGLSYYAARSHSFYSED